VAAGGDGLQEVIGDKAAGIEMNTRAGLG